MNLFQHRGIYYVQVNGKRKSLETKNKVLAKRLFKHLEREYLTGKLLQFTSKCTKKLIDYYHEYIEWTEPVLPDNTFRANKLGLKKLMKYAGESVFLDRLNFKHINLMVSDSKKNELKVRSINNYIRHVRSALNKAVDWKYIKKNPLRKDKELPVPKTKPRFLKLNEITYFISDIDDIDLRRMVISYLATGRRRKEVFILDWSNIDFEKNEYIVKVKGGKEQVYYINKLFKSVLLSIGPEKNRRVFARWKCIDSVSKYVKKALIKAGYPDFSLHSLRHSFAALKAVEGRSLKEIQELLGHSEMRTTEIYAHLTDNHLRDISEVNLGPIELFKNEKK